MEIMIDHRRPAGSRIEASKWVYEARWDVSSSSAIGCGAGGNGFCGGTGLGDGGFGAGGEGLDRRRTLRQDVEGREAGDQVCRLRRTYADAALGWVQAKDPAAC